MSFLSAGKQAAHYLPCDTPPLVSLWAHLKLYMGVHAIVGT